MKTLPGRPHRWLLSSLTLSIVAALAAIPSASAAPTGGAYCADAEEGAFLQLINAYRTANGLTPLGLSRTLGTAAEVDSAEMAATGYFAHSMSDGTTAEQNIRNQGYDDATYGENIAAGTDTAQLAFDTWRNSASHNENMLRPAFGAIGIGRAYDGGSGYGWYWTTAFGGALDEPAPVCGADPGQARTIDDVNLRRGPGRQYDVKQAVPSGLAFPIAGEEVDGYLPLDDAGETVWAATEFLAIDPGAAPADPESVPVEQTPPPVSVTETVTLRFEPSPESGAAAIIPAGEAIELSGDEAGGYLAATWEGTAGWVDADYVAVPNASATAAPSAAEFDASMQDISATATDDLNLRAEPSRSGAVVTVVPVGTVLTLTGNRENGYFEVRAEGIAAWADAAYLT